MRINQEGEKVYKYIIVKYNKQEMEEYVKRKTQHTRILHFPEIIQISDQRRTDGKANRLRQTDEQRELQRSYAPNYPCWNIGDGFEIDDIEDSFY